MTALLLSIAGTLIGPLAGLITTRLFDYVDDVKLWTAKLPDAVKQLLVVALAAVIPLINAKWGLQLPADPDQLFTQPGVQSLVAVFLAFILKGHKQVAKVAPATPTP